MGPVTIAGALAQVLAEAHGRRGARPAGAARLAGDLRQLRLVDVAAVGRADLRHAGAGARLLRRRASSRGGWACRCAAAARSAPPSSRTRRRPTRAPTRCGRRCSAGANFMLHAAGWLEGGLAMGYEKFVMDVDQLRRAAHALAKGSTLDENAMRWTPSPRSGRASTSSAARTPMRNFETAFYDCRARRQQLLRAMGARTGSTMPPRANAPLDAHAGRVRAAADRPGASTRRCGLRGAAQGLDAGHVVLTREIRPQFQHRRRFAMEPCVGQIRSPST